MTFPTALLGTLGVACVCLSGLTQSNTILPIVWLTQQPPVFPLWNMEVQDRDHFVPRASESSSQVSCLSAFAPWCLPVTTHSPPENASQTGPGSSQHPPFHLITAFLTPNTAILRDAGGAWLQHIHLGDISQDVEARDILFMSTFLTHFHVFATQVTVTSGPRD